MIVNPETAETLWKNHPGGLMGEAKVKNFLIRRSQILTERIHKSDLIEFDDSEDRVFCSQRFNKMVGGWYTPFFSIQE